MFFTYSFCYILLWSFSIPLVLGLTACYPDEVGLGVGQKCIDDYCLPEEIYQFGAIYHHDCGLLAYTMTAGNFCAAKENLLPTEPYWTPRDYSVFCQENALSPVTVQTPGGHYYTACYSIDPYESHCPDVHNGLVRETFQVNFCCQPLVLQNGKWILDPNRSHKIPEPKYLKP